MKLTNRPHPANFDLRRPRKTTVFYVLGILLGISLLTVSTPVLGEDSFDDTDYIEMLEERDKGVGWNLAFGLSGGYTDVLDGYQDYSNLGNVGVDVYFRPPIAQFPTWKDRFMFRFSADYFPLQVPDYVAYTTEDLYTLSATVICRIMKFSGRPEHQRFIPFLGVGPAIGWDHVSVEHPAVNTSGTFMHLGYSASGGFMLPTWGGFRLIPEVRYQSMQEADKYWTSHISYMLAITYWPPANVQEY
ncbi:MAG: hypothetical protein IPN90_12835 [Elusimicrobia bacterium]|nr:hypothetical protein [Elusimicrobiota bacterium]